MPFPGVSLQGFLTRCLFSLLVNSHLPTDLFAFLVWYLWRITSEVYAYDNKNESFLYSVELWSADSAHLFGCFLFFVFFSRCCFLSKKPWTKVLCLGLNCSLMAWPLHLGVLCGGVVQGCVVSAGRCRGAPWRLCPKATAWAALSCRLSIWWRNSHHLIIIVWLVTLLLRGLSCKESKKRKESKVWVLFLCHGEPLSLLAADKESFKTTGF